MDTESMRFQPPRQRGLVLNIGLILVSGLIAMALFILAAQTPLGPVFLGYLLAALAATVPIPVLVNRVYALIRSYYIVERDGIRLKWGFREVDIPITDIEYVELAEDLLFPLEFPRIQWTGAVIGINLQEKLGLVEFLAAEKDTLVMIGTEEQVFVISPDRPKAFVHHYRTVTELGSLSPLAAYSTAPSFFLVDIWRILRLRILLVLTTVLGAALFALVAWAVPTLSEVSLGFDATGEPLPPVTPGQLFLLPVLNIMLVAVSFFLSLMFFRRKPDHPVVSVLWFSNTLTSMLFLAAVLILIQVS